MTTDELRRTVAVRPAYDCIRVQPCVHGSDRCKPGTGGSHGIHNAAISMTVSGSDADVTLELSTGWYLPVTPRHLGRDHYPRGAFVEFHSARPRYEGQTRRDPVADGTCQNWPACYVDAGFGLSDEPTALLVAEGSDAVWAWLEAQYAELLAEMAGVPS